MLPAQRADFMPTLPTLRTFSASLSGFTGSSPGPSVWCFVSVSLSGSAVATCAEQVLRRSAGMELGNNESAGLPSRHKTVPLTI
eukprot:366573-Chlamydomonas_euryale.AAC.7